MRYLTIIPIAALAVASFTRVTAQQPPLVKVGDRVRVATPDMGIRNQEGTLRLLDADSLVLHPAYGEPLRLVIPLASLTRFEVHRGRKSAARLGAGIGFGVGTAWAITLLSTPSVCNPETPCSAGGWVGAIGLFGGIGAGLGGLVGLVFRSDRWEEVSLDRLRVSFAPQRDGRFALGASVSF